METRKTDISKPKEALLSLRKKLGQRQMKSIITIYYEFSLTIIAIIAYVPITCFLARFYLLIFTPCFSFKNCYLEPRHSLREVKLYNASRV